MRSSWQTASLLAGGVSVAAALLHLRRRDKRAEGTYLPSPRETLLPHLSVAAAAALPYPPDALPGGRDVPTPYGTIRVYEQGPEAGEKVLLLHGLSTPCPALGELARQLAGRGHRVMLFDLFGRGYSDAPADLPYDARLFASQALLALASSPLAWTGDEAFHLVGYSLGGALAASFAGWFPRLARSVAVVAPGGLLRREKSGWRSKLLYSRPGWGPLEGLREWLVRRKLQPGGPGGRRGGEGAAAGPEEGAALERQASRDASGGDAFDHAVLDPRRPGVTVAAVLAWQLRCHRGFVRALVRTMRDAPIWRGMGGWDRLGRALAERRKGAAPAGLRGGKVLAVLGASDSVIVMEEFVQDARGALGEDGLEVAVVDAGHEVAITEAAAVADTMASFWAERR